MRSENQNNQSRVNGKKSNGPATPRGKGKSSANSLRHGMLARTVVLPGESRERFDQLYHSIAEAIAPADFIECSLVDNMVVSRWKQMRLWGLEKASYLSDTAEDHAAQLRNPASFAGSLDMYQSRCERNFSRAIDRLLKLRAARNLSKRTQEVTENKQSPPGSVTQDQPGKSQDQPEKTQD